MGVEIERKFLVTGDAWRTGPGTRYRQGYLSLDPERTVRVRTAGDRGYLTVKGASRGAARAEYEYEIPLAEAREMLERLCRRPRVEKLRYRIDYGGLTWEVDEFLGENAGLVVAEVELEHEDQPLATPPWIGEEVTGDPRYSNASLVAHPYREWGR